MARTLFLIGASLSVVILATGCVSKSTAKAQAQAAFAAGHQAGMATAVHQNRGPDISINGPVQNPVVPWAEGLTLATVLLEANYLGPKDPASIVILRQGRAIAIDPKELLAGQDVPMQAGDAVQVRP